MTSLHTHAAASVLLVGSLLACTFGFLACSVKDESPAAAEGDGGSTAANPEPLFRIVQSDLIVRCGGPDGSCHVRGASAPHWLGGPDPYLSAKKYPGILPATREVGDSTILTQVDHVGPTLKRFPQLYDAVATWLVAELPSPPLPSSDKFQVRDGVNQVNLNTIGSGLDGARITFLAKEASVGTLSLSAIRVFAPQNANLRMDSPFFVVLPVNGKVKAEPSVNGFQGELTVSAGKSAEFYTGNMILTRWDNAGQLKIAFTKLESTPGVGSNDGCTALDVFTSKVVPELSRQIDVRRDENSDDGPFDVKGSCLGCHARDDDPDAGTYSAVLAMNLRGIKKAPVPDTATACAFARQHINFANKEQSLILLNPAGKGNPTHPVKPLANTDPIVKALTEWVAAEQP